MSDELKLIARYLRNEAAYLRAQRTITEEAKAHALEEAADDIEAGEHMRPHTMDYES